MFITLFNAYFDSTTGWLLYLTCSFLMQYMAVGYSLLLFTLGNHRQKPSDDSLCGWWLFLLLAVGNFSFLGAQLCLLLLIFTYGWSYNIMRYSFSQIYANWYKNSLFYRREKFSYSMVLPLHDVMTACCWRRSSHFVCKSSSIDLRDEDKSTMPPFQRVTSSEHLLSYLREGTI